MNTFIKSFFFMGVLLFTHPLYAAELYFDAGLGNADVEVFGLEGNDTYLKLGVGGKLSDTFSVEGGYWDLGEAEDGGATISGDGLFVNVKASTPLGSEDTRLFGKVGLFMWDSEACAGGCVSDDGNDIFFGGGVSFGNFNLEIFSMELEDADVTTIGGSYSFPF